MDLPAANVCSHLRAQFEALMLSVLACGCEVRKPRKSGVGVNTSLRADDLGEGSEPVGAGSRKMLPVQVAEPFSFAEAVELGRDDRGGALVGVLGEL